MTTVPQAKSGISYLRAVLRQAPRTITEAILFRIPHNSPKEHIALKLGRYDLTAEGHKTGPAPMVPKSMITLNREEFSALIEFLQANYQPFRHGLKRYMPLAETLGEDAVQALSRLSGNSEKERLLSVLADTDVIPEDIFHGLQHSKRVKAAERFEEMLLEDLREADWQAWFKTNSWVLGTEFVRVLDERVIDPSSETDYLMQAYDGFVDVVEIKRPGGELRFWADKQDRGNYYPSTDLTKAIIQSLQYIVDVETRMNDARFRERLGGVKVIKPRCVLLFGRSNGWNGGQREAYRVLNSSFHNLTILTYDHVLQRAKRILGIDGAERQIAMQMNPQEVDFLTSTFGASEENWRFEY